MLRFITKKEIYPLYKDNFHRKLGWEDSAIHLKTWQDMVALRELESTKNSVIGEVGGGNSRVLKCLDSSNKLYNIEKFEGVGGGPKKRQSIDGVSVFDCYIGSSGNIIPDNFFDAVFSISVIEHVPLPKIDHFFEDLIRIMKPGGLSVHLVDLYIGSGVQYDFTRQEDKFQSYIKFFKARNDLEMMGQISENFVYTSDLAANPDSMMYKWNKSVPALTDLRLCSQCVSLIILFKKRG